MKHLALMLGMMALSTGAASGQTAPVADHHQHLFSPSVVELLRGERSACSPRLSRARTRGPAGCGST
jgi:hypothetical protein